MKVTKDMCETWSVVTCKECMFNKGDSRCKNYLLKRSAAHVSARWCGLIKPESRK